MSLLSIPELVTVIEQKGFHGKFVILVFLAPLLYLILVPPKQLHVFMAKIVLTI